MIHSRVVWMLRPVDRSITVSTPHRAAHAILSTSSSMDEATAEFPMLALILTRNSRPMADDHRLGLGVVDVGRDDRAAMGHFRPDLLRLHTLAQRHELHLRGDGAAAGVAELGDRAAAGPYRAPTGVVEDRVQGVKLLDVGPALQPVAADPVVQQRARPAVVLLDVPALAHPGVAQPAWPPAHVHLVVGVGRRTAGVVEHHRVAGGQHHLAHRYPQNRVSAAARRGSGRSCGSLRARPRERCCWTNRGQPPWRVPPYAGMTRIRLWRSAAVPAVLSARSSGLSR